jgi:hypothetical protein
MTTVGPVSLLIAQIQAQAASWRRQRAVGGEAARPDPEAGLREEPTNWATYLSQEVRSIRPDDPQRHRKAFRVYLQSLLARECGITRIDDPGLLDLVDRVQETMERDPAICSAIQRAGEELLRSAS